MTMSSQLTLAADFLASAGGQRRGNFYVDLHYNIVSRHRIPPNDIVLTTTITQRKQERRTFDSLSKSCGLAYEMILFAL